MKISPLFAFILMTAAVLGVSPLTASADAVVPPISDPDPESGAFGGILLIAVIVIIAGLVFFLLKRKEGNCRRKG